MMLDADRPLTDPAADQLGYAPFAKHLATAISKLKPERGLVIGLHGPWGSGKSSTVGFLVHYLNRLDEPTRPVLVEFNPWWFSGGDDDLVRRFFYQLRAQLARWKDFAGNLGDTLAEYGELVGDLPVPGAGFAGKAFGLLRSGKKDPVALKKELERLLGGQKRTIVVVLDDIDRLQAEEVRSLFKLIKAVADFPNVVYLVVFDQDVITKALEGAQTGLPGAQYLEKIVQVPFALPLPDRAVLRKLLFSRLGRLLENVPSNAFDSERWANVYLKGIDWLIESPRDVVRLTNALAVTHAAVRDEVNHIDFIALEALRIFRPVLYEIIRANPESFAGGDSDHLSQYRQDELRTFHEGWLAHQPEEERDALKSLFVNLFPRLDGVWKNTLWGRHWDAEWRRNLRVCHPDCFPAYFRLALPDGAVSNVEMQQLLAMGVSSQQFAERLLQLAQQRTPAGTSRAREALDRLTDYVEKHIPDDHIEHVVIALLDVADQLLIPEDYLAGMYEFDNRFRVGWVVRPLLKRLDGARREAVLTRGIKDGRSLYFTSDLIWSLGRQHGKYGADEKEDPGERFVTREQHDVLERLCLEKICRAAHDGSLLRAPMCAWVIWAWKTWATDKSEVANWLSQQLATDTGLVSILSSMAQRSFRQSVSSVVGEVRYTIGLKDVAEFGDPEALLPRVNAILAAGSLEDRQRVALDAFVRAMARKANGKPGDPWRGDDD